MLPTNRMATQHTESNIGRTRVPRDSCLVYQVAEVSSYSLSIRTMEKNTINCFMANLSKTGQLSGYIITFHRNGYNSHSNTKGA